MVRQDPAVEHVRVRRDDAAVAATAHRDARLLELNPPIREKGPESATAAVSASAAATSTGK